MRSRRPSAALFPVNVWPPFVDALTLVLAAFVLLMMVALVAQRALVGRLRERDQELSRLRDDKARIERRLRALAPQGVIDIDDGKVILQGEVLFDTGSDALRAEGERLMTEIGRNLTGLLAAEHGQLVLVGGHTDDRPIHATPASRFASNWDLSSARALAVARVLMRAGLPADRVVAAGFGEHHPRAPNADETGRARNRRIEVLLVPLQAVSSR
jgi:flagellar motor protein MotB